jgi:predicted metal-binding membrane protein
MASLFALGVMSIVWMAVIAGVIAVERPSRGVESREPSGCDSSRVDRITTAVSDSTRGSGSGLV